MFNVSDKIRLNPELCPQEKLDQKHFQFGALNYPVLALDWECEVVEAFTDQYHGAMVAFKVLNDYRIEPDTIVYFRADDCIISKETRVKIDFEILGKQLKVQPLIDLNRGEREVLMKERDKLRKTNDKASKVMQANWKAVKHLDEKLEELKLNTSTNFLVRTVKHGTFELDCKEDQIETTLRREIRKSRANAKKIMPVEKIISGGMKYEKVGGVLAKSGEFAKLNKDFAIKIINEHKKPVTKEDNYVGIELECFGPLTIEEMKDRFIKAGLKKYVNVGTDGSIRTNDSDEEYAMEIRLCIAEKDLETIMPKVFDVIDNEGFNVNVSCGTHVHVDMRNRDPELAYANLFKVQKLMMATQPKARRKNSYCKENKVAELSKSQFDSNERYSVINTQSYNKHKTLEVRLHAGTVNYEDMKAWVEFLVAVVSKTDKLSTEISTIEQLNSLGIVSAGTSKHLAKRVKKYA